MARRQTYREGPPTPDEHYPIFDFDLADQEPYYNRRYESHLYQTEQEKSQEIFRLLRALSERLDARDRRRAHQLRPHDTDDETVDHQNALTPPAFPVETGQPEYAHTTIEENSLPERRSTTAEENQPEASPPTPDTTTSVNHRELYNQDTSTHRDTHSGLIPMRKDHDRGHTILVEESKINRATDPNSINSATGHQTEIPRHATQVGDVRQEDTVTTPRAVTYHTEQPMQPPRPPQTRNPIPDKNREPYSHISQNFAISTHRHNSTLLDLSASSSEGSYDAYPHRQPIDTSTPNPGTKLITNHTTGRSTPIPNWREPFTGRDTRLIPDRGKSFKRS